MEPKVLKQGGDYTVFHQDGGAVECFPTVEDAIENMVAYYGEDEIPAAYTIRDTSGMTVATLCPIGSDKLLVVRSNGDTMTWEGIHYVKVNNKIEYTSAWNNAIEYRFKV